MLPKSKKVTTKLIRKIKQTEVPLEGGKPIPCAYDAIVALGKLFECEIQVMKKIQRQIAKYQARSVGKTLDLQITQLYQAIDMRGTGRLTKKQIKGLLSS